MVEWGDGKIDTKTRLLVWEAPSECLRGLLVTVLSPFLPALAKGPREPFCVFRYFTATG